MILSLLALGCPSDATCADPDATDFYTSCSEFSADYGGDDGIPGFPFPETSGHGVTTTPDGHAKRGVNNRNWDLDCEDGDPMGAIRGGLVVAVADDVTGYAEKSYGNYVCIYDDSTGFRYCQNHMQYDSLELDASDVGVTQVSQGDLIGNCGLTGTVTALGGGDGSHVDVYAKNESTGEPVELPDPSTWSPLATLDPIGSRDCEPSGSLDLTSVDGRSVYVSGTVAADEGLKKYSVVVDSDSPPAYKETFSDGSTFTDAFDAALDLSDYEYGSKHTLGLWVVDVNDCDGDAAVASLSVTLGESDCEDDDDRDGYDDESCGGPDCDDRDDDTHPGAREQCNGVDDDCDGQIDESVSYDSWYPDDDGDGYGDDSGAVSDCEQPSGYVDNDDDCDDRDDGVHPGATEQCNGEDDDCDGAEDEGATSTYWYPDDDRDGFGDDSSSGTYDCEAPSGYVDNDEDCDDGDDDVNPDGTDDACTSADEDCSGSPASPDTKDHKGCYSDDVYYYDECGTRHSAYKSCGSTSACDSSTLDCGYHAEWTSTATTTCGSGSETIFQGTPDPAIAWDDSDPSVDVEWEKCDGTSLSSAHTCDVRVGSATSGASSRLNFTWSKGSSSKTTTFDAWLSASDFASDPCGETKEFYITCDEGTSTAYWNSDDPVTVEKICP